MLNEIRCDFEDDICFFYVEDETIETDVDLFLQMLRDALDELPVKGFILDFSNVTYLSSTTIGFLFVLLKEFRTDTKPFAICGVDSNLETTIKLVGMTKLCHQTETLEEATAYILNPA